MYRTHDCVRVFRGVSSGMYLQQISDRKLAQHAYLLGCETSKQAIIIDPERDIDRYFTAAAGMGLELVAAAETHIHADYLSGLRECGEAGLRLYASKTGDAEWQYDWLKNSSYQYELLTDGDEIPVGSVRCRAVHSPGHTPEHLSYLIFDGKRDQNHPLALITGDFLFVADLGRPDLLEVAAGFEGTMQSSARALFQSIQLLHKLPSSLLVLPNHSAGSSCGKGMSQTTMTTLGYELLANPALRAATTEDAFVSYILAGQPEPPPYFARMKELNRSGPPLLNALPRPRELHAADFSLLADQNLVVLDTRDWADFRACRIRGSLFAPPDKEFPTTVGSYVLPEEILCLVVEPARLDELIRDCIRIGFDQVRYFITPDTLRAAPIADLIVSGTREKGMHELPSIRKSGDALLLDVRKSSELAETGCIAGAINIPHVQLRRRYLELPPDRNVHLWCRTGNRSRFAYSLLERMQRTVTLCDGGIAAWQAQQGEFVPCAAGNLADLTPR